MKTQYIVYHDNCLDGFLSAMLMLSNCLYEAKDNIKNMIMVPVNYGDKDEDGKYKVVDAAPGDTVFMVDFSYPAEYVNALLNKGVDVGIFDHHRTTNDELIKNIDPREKVLELTKDCRLPSYNCTDCNGSGLFGRLMQNEEVEDRFKMSGAGIVLDYATMDLKYLQQDCGIDIIKSVAIAEIHDLWLHNGDVHNVATHLAFWFKNWYRDVKELREKIVREPHVSMLHFRELRRIFASTTLAEKIAIGEALVDKDVEAIREECKKAVTVKLKGQTLLDNLRVGFIPGDGPMTLGISTTGSILVKEFGYDVAIMTAVTKDDSIIYSLRSDQNGQDVDVAFICKMYHESGLALTGGGHRNAAGVTFAKQGDFFEILE